jgi:hypothetical protein
VRLNSSGTQAISFGSWRYEVDVPVLFMLHDAKPRHTSMLALSIEIYFESWFRMPNVSERSCSVPFGEEMSRIEWSSGFVKRRPLRLEYGKRRGGTQSEALGVILFQE